MDLFQTASGPIVGSTLGEELARVAKLHALGPNTPLDHVAEFSRDVEWVRERDLSSPAMDIENVLSEAQLPLSVVAWSREPGELQDGPPYSARVPGAVEHGSKTRSGQAKPVVGYGHTPAEAVKTLSVAMQGKDLMLDGRKVHVPAHLSASKLMAEMDVCRRENLHLLQAAHKKDGAVSMRRNVDGTWDSSLAAREGEALNVSERKGTSFSESVTGLANATLDLAAATVGLRPLSAPRVPVQEQTISR
jgi:hypothetical protein